jgi:hypothetical protein
VSNIVDEQVTVGEIGGFQALACTQCGTFLWNIDIHYALMHPDWRPATDELDD